MKRRILIAVLALGTVGGYASAFHSMRCHNQDRQSALRNAALAEVQRSRFAAGATGAMGAWAAPSRETQEEAFPPKVKVGRKSSSPNTDLLKVESRGPLAARIGYDRARAMAPPAECRPGLREGRTTPENVLRPPWTKKLRAVWVCG